MGFAVADIDGAICKTPKSGVTAAHDRTSDAVEILGGQVEVGSFFKPDCACAWSNRSCCRISTSFSIAEYVGCNDVVLPMCALEIHQITCCGAGSLHEYVVQLAVVNAPAHERRWAILKRHVMQLHYTP